MSDWFTNWNPWTISLFTAAGWAVLGLGFIIKGLWQAYQDRRCL